MANVVRKWYRYLSASANKKLDERADPRVQLEQAIDEARRQHHAFVQQAAAVVGNQRQLEMRMARQIEEVDNLTESAQQALRLADTARAAGDEPTAQRYEQTAQAFASQLVSAESSLEDMKSLHGQAVAAAAQARAAVEDNTLRLEQMMTERARLLTQIEHAAMQEQMSKSLESMSPLAPAGDSPTLGQIRDKVERRHALALGRQELASQGVEARMLEVRRATMDARAANRLAELRGSMGGGQGVGGGQLGAGQTAAGQLGPSQDDHARSGAARSGSGQSGSGQSGSGWSGAGQHDPGQLGAAGGPASPGAVGPGQARPGEAPNLAKPATPGALPPGPPATPADGGA